MKKSHSTRYWFLLFLSIYICCSSVLAVFVSIHTLHNLREESAQNRLAILNFYMQQTDTSLRNAYTSLLQFGQSNEDLISLQIDSTSVSENYLCRSSLRQDLLSLSVTQADITGYFLYVPSDAFGNDYFTYTINGTQTQVNNISRPVFLEFAKEACALQSNMDSWFIAPLSGQYYLFCITASSNSYLGCYINIDSLIKPLDKIEAQNGYSLFADSSGHILTENVLALEQVSFLDDSSTYQMETLDGQEYISINAQSSVVDMYLFAFISNQTIFQSFSPFFITLLIILLAIILLLPLLFLIFWSVMNSSLSGLLSTIEQIKIGNTHARADTGARISEIATLNHSFNEMLDEISQLKIKVYEQKLKERQIYLDYLQIQIHPHFFLNCLNLVYSLAELKRYGEIKSLSLNLVKYLRFLFHRSSSLISVQEEIDHVKNYISIHQFRLATQITCDIQVDPGLETALIPPLSIQTFAENSVKYGQNSKASTEICISVVQAGEHMRVTVRDHGKGFPADILLALNAGKRLSTDEIHRIGITNVRERLTMLFGENASIRFYNNQGSVTEILLPVSFGPTQEKEVTDKHETAGC